MDTAFSAQQLQEAFDKAEGETGSQFNGQTCSLVDKDGKHTCPICFFRQRVRAHLGIPPPCTECGGKGILRYVYSEDDVKEAPCWKCKPGPEAETARKQFHAMFSGES